MIDAPRIEGVDVVRLGEGDLARLSRFCFEGSDFFELVEGQPGGDEQAREMLGPLEPAYAAGTRFVFGLEEKGELLGVVELLEGHPAPRDWYVGLLLLRPDRRGGGLGARAFAGVRAWIAARGGATVRVVVQRQNPRARAFWEREGFALEREVTKRSGRLEGPVAILARAAAPQPVAAIDVGDGYALTGVRAEDRDDYVRWLADGDVARAIPGMPQPYTVEAADAWIHRRLAFAARFGVEVCLSIRDAAGRLVGSVGVDDAALDGGGRGELGYWLGRDHRGRGLARRAVEAFLPHAFGALALHRLTARAFAWNLPSIRILERVGFTRLDEGRFPAELVHFSLRARHADPWLRIPTEDYETHMRAVGQADALIQLFGAVWAARRPRRLAILGCTTLNDLSRVDFAATEHVVGVDLNLGSLSIARARHAAIADRLTLVAGDVMEVALVPASFDLVHAALLLEYLDDPVSLFARVRGWLAPGGTFSITSQEPDAALAAVSPTPFTSLRPLAGAMVLRSADELVGHATRAGFRLADRREIVLPSGKHLVSSVFEPF
ncbi:MAG TPA: GNAT family N-acetyltransferase [Polyangia bacterium]|nr:GNAT family N-acetyltransferase [Polyangia bacterium]